MNPVEISPEQFRRLAERVTRLTSDYLETLDSRPIAPRTTGAETVSLFQEEMPEKGIGEEAFNLLPEVIRCSRAQNGRFFAYVLGSGEPVGAVGDLLVSVLNQNATAWRSGPSAIVIEQMVVGWLAQAMGCNGLRGHLT